MPHPVLLFGHGAPLDAPELAGLALRDVTRQRHLAPKDSQIADMLEPFLDPFVRSFLFGLETGAFDAHAIVVWRQGAGALHAFRYACELRRLGLLPDGPPLHLWNRAGSTGAAAETFNTQQAEHLARAVDGAAKTPPIDPSALTILEGRQAAGAILGAEAFRRRLTARETGAAVDLSPAPPATGPRLALAGAPLGGDALHRWLDRQGVLVLDMQGPDAPPGDIATLLTERRVETLVWQVDPHDDLHGWRMPRLRALCADLGIRFSDLGFVPTWPTTFPEVLP
ncbi:MAG: hypothetical protein KDJ98_07100 [Rhodobacteraceae bacterium]|nr:hypothetical protein [Paracoccaceae bacterium]